MSSPILERLARVPRIPLAHLPTPLDYAPRFSRALGGPRLFIKRDDMTGLALGGNKARKLEFLLADARAKGADCIVISAAAQSNMVRMTAAAACRLGMDTYAVLRSLTDTPPVQGNLLLDALFGARVTYIATKDPYSQLSVEVMNRLTQKLNQQGRKPYLIDLRYHSAPLAALGYFLAVHELEEQFSAQGINPDYLFVSVGSGTTLAGLLLGASLLKKPYKIIGVSVQKPSDWIAPRVREKLTETAKLLAIDPQIVSDVDLIIDDRWIGQEYGVPTPEGIEAIKLAGQTEGIAFDPVYTGKGLAGLIGWIRAGKIAAHQTAVFIHSGGIPALFALADTLSRDLMPSRMTLSE